MNSYEKLQGRLREEKRAAKLLRAQLVEERAAAAAAALARVSLPMPVGLDLSASNVDAGSYRLPALAVAARPAAGAAPGGGSGGGLQGDMATLLEVSPRADEEASGEGWTYLCLGADNCLYEVGARQVAAVLAGGKGDSAGASRRGGSSSSDSGSGSPRGFIEAVRAAAAAAAAAPPASDKEAARHAEREARAQAEQRRAWVDAAAAVADHAASLHPLAWKQLAGGARSAPGSALTATAAARLPSASALPDVPLPVSGAVGGVQALTAQRARVKEVKRQLADLRDDRAFARASRQYARVAARTGVLLRRAKQLRAEAAAPGDASWAAFEALLGVLEAAGALVRPDAPGPAGESPRQAEQGQQEAGWAAEAQDEQKQPCQGEVQEEQQAPGRVRFTPLGLVARDLNGQNELWLAAVLTHPAFQGLPPPQLAAAVSAAVAPEAVSRSGAWVAYPPSAIVVAAVEALEGERARLAALQVAAGVEAPLPIDLRLAGIVEAWASGAEWSAVMADCSLDDGDAVRLLGRTVDLLRQAAHCPHLLLPLRASARRAASAMDRKPISELVAGVG